MLKNPLRMTSLRNTISSGFFMLALASVLVALTSSGSLASEDPIDPIMGPLAKITAVSNSYSYQTAPTFKIDAGSNSYYKVELALANKLFDGGYGRRITAASDVNQNFYSSGYKKCGTGIIDAIATSATEPADGCDVTFTIPGEVWTNLRGSRVFYRVITASDPAGSNIRYSTTDGNWADAPFIGRTGEAWYGLPLNDQARAYSSKTGSYYSVVVGGKLQGTALESDYGPRNVSKGTRFHPGLDISVPMNTPVYAIADGTVENNPAQSTVHRLDLKHLSDTSGEYLSSYIHLDSWLVSEGDEVKTGQLIAYSGDKGENVGPHLHFEAGIRDGDKYHNPLHYIPYLDDHTIPDGAEMFIGNHQTNNRAIDIQNAAGNQKLILIGFGISTEYDKDLNYVKVAVDGREEDKWSFLLHYDEVRSDPQTGEVTLKSDKKFRIRPMDYQIYNDTNLKDLFIVKADSTYGGTHARDYFYLPWDVSSLEEDSGPHTVMISAAEVGDENDPKTHSITVGTSIWATDALVDQLEMSLELWITNFDIPEIQEGTIKLEVRGLPIGWSASFSDENPSIEVGESESVTLTLSASPPYAITAEAMRENKTRIVATLGRLPALTDNYVICPATAPNLNTTSAASSEMTVLAGEFCPTGTPAVTILEPQDGGKVPVGKEIDIKIFAAGAEPDASASVVVSDLYTGSNETLTAFTRDGNTYTFRWTPTDRDHEYSLVGRVHRFEDSKATLVTAVLDEVVFIQPTEGRISGGEQINVIVEAPPEATKVVLDIDPANPTSGGEMIKTPDGKWQYTGWTPSTNVDYYNLTATAHLPDGSRPYSIIRVEPIPDDPTIDIPETVLVEKVNGKIVTKVDVTVTAPRAFAVSLLTGGGSIEELGQDGDIWRFKWTPDATGTFNVYAVATYSAHADKWTETVAVQVIDEGQNAIQVDITDPEDGDEIAMGKKFTVWVESPGELTKVKLEITDPNGVTTEKIVTATDVGKNFSSVGIPWTPAIAGRHELRASGWNEVGQKGWTENPISVSVFEPPDPGTRIRINEHSFLWKNKTRILAEFQEGTYWNDWTDKFFDTQISYSDHICGIVGFAARGGDIGEEANNMQIIQVYMPMEYSRSKGTWHLMLDFQTWNGSDRKETWDITLLCFDREVVAYDNPDPDKPLFIKKFEHLGDDVGNKHEKSTGIRVEEYLCGIVGFDSNIGDIEEHGDGDIIKTYLYPKNGEWHIRADFRTHNGNKEDWRVDVLCASREWAALDSPEVGHPMVFKEYKNLGDNISHPTEFSVEDWTCGVVGFAARDGDIDEGSKGSETNLFLMYMYEDHGSGVWRIRADFRTHKDSESWDANVLCFHKDLDAAPEFSSATPQLFTGVHDQASGSKYGTGMHLEWTQTHHPDAAFYDIRYSEDGAKTWHTYTNRRAISHGGWINHHGSLDCGYNYKLCLKRNQSLHYQVRVLDEDGQPLTDWSDMIRAIAPDWPADVEMTEPSPPGPYWSGSTVTIDLKKYFGPNLIMDWKIINYNTAEHIIVEGCEDGLASNWTSRFCELEIFSSSADAPTMQGAGMSSVLGHETSVHVEVYVSDSWGHKDMDYVVLEFESENPTNTQSFQDVLPEHWAVDYVEYLHDQQITSGCTTDGDPKYCPEDPLLRSEMAVYTSRSRHPEEPGYTPTSPEQVVFIDEEAQPLASVASSNPDPVYREEIYWYDKYVQELYDEGVISGCSQDPMKYCPNDATTRGQMTVFVVRLLHGEAFTPDEPSDQIYSDVPLFDVGGNRIWSAKWIDQATVDGLVQACGTDMENKLFRPEQPVTRAEAACMMYYALNGQVE